MPFNVVFRNSGLGLNIAFVELSVDITIVRHTRAKISDVVGYTNSDITFQCSANATQWCARATTDAQTPSYGVGSLVGSGGIINANTDVAFDVDCTELISGDVAYKIVVYCYVGGVWYG